MFSSSQEHPQQVQSLFGSPSPWPVMQQTNVPLTPIPAFGSTWGTATTASNRGGAPHSTLFSNGAAAANLWAVPAASAAGNFGQGQPMLHVQQQQHLQPQHLLRGGFVVHDAPTPFGHAPIKQGAAFAATAAAAVPCKRAIGERKTSLDNALVFGGFSLPGRNGGGASPGSGSGKGRRQLRRRSKKGADGRTTDSTGSPPTAPSVAAPRFTRNFDHLRLLLDAFQAVLGVNGGESATNETAAAASNERAPLMVLHDLLARQRRPNGTAVLSRDNGDAADECEKEKCAEDGGEGAED